MGCTLAKTMVANVVVIYLAQESGVFRLGLVEVNMRGHPTVEEGHHEEIFVREMSTNLKSTEILDYIEAMIHWP